MIFLIWNIVLLSSMFWKAFELPQAHICFSFCNLKVQVSYAAPYSDMISNQVKRKSVFEGLSLRSLIMFWVLSNDY